MVLCSVNQERHCIKVETIRDVHSYVMDGVNCDTVSFLVYNSPCLAKDAAAAAAGTYQ